ncbi:MAG: hypothetical protein ACYTJ0_14115 [Planctomycetota bacterium]|jgi:hypothetical protein
MLSPDAAGEPFRWTEAGGVELLLLGVAVLLTLAIGGVFAVVLLRRDPADPAGRADPADPADPAGSAGRRAGEAHEPPAEGPG